MLQTIVGRRGTGKTSLAWWTVRSLRAQRVLILDYKGTFANLASDRVYVKRYLQQSDVYSFCKLAWDLAGKSSRTLVVFDEFKCFGKDNPHVEWLYRMGRDWNIDLIAVAHKFYDLSEYVRALTDFYSIFQVVNPTDLNFLKGYLPDSQVKAIRELPNFKYVNVTF